MTTNQPLSLFISSKMQELLDERQAVQAALKEYDMYGWLWEKDAGARPEPIDSTYLKEVEACDIYIGLFWLGYGPYTIEEYEHAHKHQKPCLIYKKQVDIAKRDPQLKAFLAELERVKNPEGLTVYRFEAVDELAAQVKKDVIRLLTTRFRESRQQPTVPSASPDSVTLTADRGGIAVYNNTGTITQNTQNYGRPEDKR
jgi:ATP-dependent DNA helicase RecG